MLILTHIFAALLGAFVAIAVIVVAELIHGPVEPDDAGDTEGQGFAEPLPRLNDSALQELRQ